MEVEESQTHQGGKHPRKGDEQQYPDEEEDGDVKRRSNGGGDGGGGGGGFDFNPLCGWPSSRIVRVSRASGGKDRHSKVLTSKGLRDRRVRLSVNTAIQFYDLQDRLGVDQPSKAVEWLLQAAARSIAELPSINTPYLDITAQQQQQQQQQLGDERRSPGAAEHGFDSADVEIAGSFDPNYQLQGQHHQQHRHQNAALSKSNSCSTSETSKGSGLSLSGSESRIKRRERARERALEKERDKESETTTRVVDQFRQDLNPISQNASSFTELLTNGMNTSTNMGGNSSNTNGLVHQNHSAAAGVSEGNFLYKSPRQWSSTPMDYFASELLGPASTRAGHGFPGQIHFGEHYQEMQPFAFVSDHFVPLVTVAAGNNVSNNNNNNNNNNEHDLNFTISSASSSSPSLAGFNRGTLQSNSFMPQLQRFSSADGSPSAFFIGAPQPHNAPVENHHHHHHHHSLTGFDARLQLCHGDGRHSDYKGKGKS